MRDFTLLEKRVESGEIILAHAIGVPRSMSTAFGRAINESDANSLFINEPFNRNNDARDQSARVILDAVDHDFDERPTLVIVKNMASYISEQSFRSFESLSRLSFWNIRRPLAQMGSLLTRIVNDNFIPGDTAPLEQQDIYPYLDLATDWLESSPKSTNFSKTGWASILEHFKTSTTTPRMIVDGDDFVNKPQIILNDACQALGVDFRPDMIGGWGKGYLNVINSEDPDETAKSDWTSHVWISNGIKSNLRPDLDLTLIPEALKSHILDVAMPVYEELSGR